MTNNEFATMHKAAKISSVEFAHFVGCTVKWMLQVEGGEMPVENWMVQSLNNMIKAKEER